jgi:tRNA-2-methylthio-N6-dimethylallyladenosine synthase
MTSTEKAHLKTITQSRLLYVKTFGCQMNEYDSLRVQRILHSQGYSLTSEMASADIIFLNTCSVREKAEQKVHSFLGRLRHLKGERPELKIIVGGCVAQQLGKKLLERFDHLDLVLGTRGISAIGELLEAIQETRDRLAHVPDEEAPRHPCERHVAPIPGAAAVSAPVTIMQGCNNFCTYCIVPYVRGRERSCPAEEIILEIQALSAGGVREILLLGQNVNSYGRGLDERTGFADLLHRIQKETDVGRLRFTTSHPKDLSRELIECFAVLPCLCKHLHLPVQAGSDSILSRMNRGYTASQYVEKIHMLRRACPDIAVTADVMVGFPGETEDDFRKTLQLLEAVQFDNLFSFRYSDRPYARSSEFPDKVDAQTKGRRLFELQHLQAEITLRKNQMEVGSIREILVEGPSQAANGQLTGRTSQNRVVNFDGSKGLIGQTICVKITSALSHSLKGEPQLPRGIS